MTGTKHRIVDRMESLTRCTTTLITYKTSTTCDTESKTRGLHHIREILNKSTFIVVTINIKSTTEYHVNNYH